VLLSNGGWTYSDIYAMPISKRNWIFRKFVQLNKPVEPEAEAVE